MSILKFERRTPRSLQEMYDYLTDPHKTNETYIFGIGCNPIAAVSEMQFVKNIFYKNHYKHPYIQVIFSFDRGLNLHYYQIKQICFEIGKALLLENDKRQIFAAIHLLGKDQDNIHCHYLINSVNINGKPYDQAHHLNFYKKRINNILRYYGLTPIVMYESNVVSHSA